MNAKLRVVKSTRTKTVPVMLDKYTGTTYLYKSNRSFAH